MSPNNSLAARAPYGPQTPDQTPEKPPWKNKPAIITWQKSQAISPRSYSLRFSRLNSLLRLVPESQFTPGPPWPRSK